MPAADDEHWQQIGHVFLVADGMGAHAVGELASKMAVDNIPHIYSKYAQDGVIVALKRAFVEGNSIINTRGNQNREFKGMGTTGTALVLRPEGAWVGHVGDSRAYRVRGGVIEQLSFDHSLLWELARRQRKHPDELTGIPSNVIVRSLGPEPVVAVDVEGPHPLERGDVYLLCSDGLSGQVNDRVIGAVMTALPPDEAAQFLVHMANLQGGPDNTTVVVVRVGGEPRSQSLDSQAEVVFQTTESFTPIVPRFALMMYYLGRLPWAFIILALGIGMAGVAIVLAALEQGSAMYVFIVAGLLLLSGILALMLQTIREGRKKPGVEAEEERILQVYRQTPCPLDEAMYDKLMQGTKSLEEDIKGKDWQYEQKVYQDHVKQASQHANRRRYRDAFRAQCRAMLVLMEAVHRYRGKNEGFKPVWDRPTAG